MPGKSTNTASLSEDELTPTVERAEGAGPVVSAIEGFQTGHWRRVSIRLSPSSLSPWVRWYWVFWETSSACGWLAPPVQ